MAHETTTTTGTILTTERAGTSRMGNPTWRIILTDGRTHLTIPNGSVGYSAANHRRGAAVTLELTAAGRVVGAWETRYARHPHARYTLTESAAPMVSARRRGVPVPVLATLDGRGGRARRVYADLPAGAAPVTYGAELPYSTVYYVRVDGERVRLTDHDGAVSLVARGYGVTPVTAAGATITGPTPSRLSPDVRWCLTFRGETVTTTGGYFAALDAARAHDRARFTS